MAIELYKNSLITLEEAELYFDERYDSKEWFNLDKKEKETILITASQKINSFDFIGSKLIQNQPMEFPRNYELPQDIKNAVCEEAIKLLKNNKNIHQQNQENNISSINLGDSSVSYKFSKPIEHSLASNLAYQLIQKWIKKGYNLNS